jgi:hypothetical protein
VTAKQQLDLIIGKYAPDVARVTGSAVRWMRKKSPGANVLVYDNYNSLVIGFGPSDRGSHAPFSIAVYPRWANLCFLRGACLPDPHKRLSGSGKDVRTVRLDSVRVLEEPAILKLLGLAAAQFGMSRGPIAPGRS